MIFRSFDHTVLLRIVHLYPRRHRKKNMLMTSGVHGPFPRLHHIRSFLLHPIHRNSLITRIVLVQYKKIHFTDLKAIMCLQEPALHIELKRIVPVIRIRKMIQRIKRLLAKCAGCLNFL